MKKAIFLQVLCVSILIAGFSSCSKDDNGPSSSFQASFNGTVKVFSKAAQAQKDALGANSLVVTGIAANNETISLAIVSTQAITAGSSYTVASYPNNDLIFVGTDATGWAASFAPTQPEIKFDCTVTQISATEVKGTFSGDIYSSVDGSKMTVTNGTFSAKF